MAKPEALRPVKLDLVSCVCESVFVCSLRLLLLAQVLALLARRRLPELAGHFHEIDFSVDMVSNFTPLLLF